MTHSRTLSLVLSKQLVVTLAATGVALSTATLVIVLLVMNGYRAELIAKVGNVRTEVVGKAIQEALETEQRIMVLLLVLILSAGVLSLISGAVGLWTRRSGPV
jgi:ABC-type lipoprotein release transport system permease subunit